MLALGRPACGVRPWDLWDLWDLFGSIEKRSEPVSCSGEEGGKSFSNDLKWSHRSHRSHGTPSPEPVRGVLRRVADRWRRMRVRGLGKRRALPGRTDYREGDERRG